MAVYRIFPEKDTTLYSEYSDMNTGLDEIVELSAYYKGDVAYVNRALIQFDSTEIADVLETHVSSSTRAATDISASLKLYLASANEVPTSYNVYAYPAYVAYSSHQWINGNGKYGDLPRNSSGASWFYTQASSSLWTAAIPTGATSSYSGSNTGGGVWYTGSGAYNFEATQSHTVASTHDVDINITQGVKAHYAGTITNAGFIVKLEDGLEFNTDRQMYLRFFSVDTHTIYPPCLEIKWDDFASDNTLNEVTDTNATVKIKNNRGTYTDEGKQRFELTVRPKYPARTFTTSSVYLTNYYLPTASYWGLRDENTEEMVIDFDTVFTKLSRTATGNYFDMYMGGLEPERYYRILLKTEINGSTNIIDEDVVFKVVRNG